MLLTLTGFFETSYLIGLRAFGALDDVELDLIPLFEALVALALDGTVVNEDVGATISTKEAVAFCVVKPFNCALVLCHWSDSLSLLLQRWCAAK